MVTRSQKIRLGVFITVVTVLLILFFIIVAGKKLMEKRDYYYINYRNVSVIGLQAGSSVKYYGINIGQVADITIDKADINNVIVKISVKKGTPIKEDVMATLVSVGITGIKQIELTGGSNQADLLLPGSNIQPGTSTIEDITGRAEVIAEKAELLLNNLTALTADDNRIKVGAVLTSAKDILEDNREVLHASLTNLNRLLRDNNELLKSTLRNANALIQENRQPLRNVLRQLDSSAYHLAEFSRSSRIAMDKVNRILDSPNIESALANTAAFSESLAATNTAEFIENLNATLNNLNGSIENLNTAITHVDLAVLKGRQDLLKTIESMRKTAEYLNEFSRKINDDPSILLRSRK